jgi:hypothetical protein
VQVDNPITEAVWVRLELTASGALGTAMGAGAALPIGLPAGLAERLVRAWCQTACRASLEFRNDRSDALNQEIPGVVDRYFVFLDLRGPVAGKAQRDKAIVCAHDATQA